MVKVLTPTLLEQTGLRLRFYFVILNNRYSSAATLKIIKTSKYIYKFKSVKSNLYSKIILLYFT